MKNFHSEWRLGYKKLSKEARRDWSSIIYLKEQIYFFQIKYGYIRSQVPIEGVPIGGVPYKLTYPVVTVNHTESI